MKAFYFFAVFLVLITVPLVYLLARRLFRGSVVFPISLAFNIHPILVAILSYFIAITNLYHLLWVLPLAIISGVVWLEWLRSQIGKPIKELKNTIDSIAKGKFDDDIDAKLVNRNNEIGQIAAAINKMLTNLKASVRIAEMVAQGRIYGASNASAEIVEKGDLDEALQKMIVKLNAIITEINNSSGVIVKGADEISTSAQSVARGSSQQAVAIEEISSSMEEMSSVILQNAENAQQTEEIAKRNVSNMEVVKLLVNNSITSVTEIADKIGIVNEIALKTDILAINASIEAARAGVYGKGFSVVAAEIRKLAERTQKAAAIITDLSTRTLNEANLSGEMLAKSIPDIERSKTLAQDINASISEQNLGNEQIYAAIVQLNNVTQGNAALSEELASSSELLAGQSEFLRESVAYFKLHKSHEEGLRNELIGKIREMNRYLEANFKDSALEDSDSEVLSPRETFPKESMRFDLKTGGDGDFVKF
jgi:methyl-accepting chemotaxis protein